MHRCSRWIAVLVGVLLLYSNIAIAQDNEKTEANRVGFKADEIDLDLAGGGVILTGNVEITMKDLTLTSQSAQINQEKGYAKATGNARVVTQGSTLTSDTVEIDTKANTTIASGNARLERGGTIITADKVEIEEGGFSASGNVNFQHPKAQATCQSATLSEVEGGENKIELQGNVNVSMDTSNFKGEIIEMYIKGEEISKVRILKGSGSIIWGGEEEETEAKP